MNSVLRYQKTFSFYWFRNIIFLIFDLIDKTNHFFFNPFSYLKKRFIKMSKALFHFQFTTVNWMISNKTISLNNTINEFKHLFCNDSRKTELSFDKSINGRCVFLFIRYFNWVIFLFIDLILLRIKILIIELWFLCIVLYKTILNIILNVFSNFLYLRPIKILLTNHNNFSFVITDKYFASTSFAFQFLILHFVPIDGKEEEKESLNYSLYKQFNRFLFFLISYFNFQCDKTRSWRDIFNLYAVHFKK